MLGSTSVGQFLMVQQVETSRPTPVRAISDYSRLDTLTRVDARAGFSDRSTTRSCPVGGTAVGSAAALATVDGDVCPGRSVYYVRCQEWPEPAPVRADPAEAPSGSKSASSHSRTRVSSANNRQMTTTVVPSGSPQTATPIATPLWSHGGSPTVCRRPACHTLAVPSMPRLTCPSDPAQRS